MLIKREVGEIKLGSLKMRATQATLFSLAPLWGTENFN